MAERLLDPRMLFSSSRRKRWFDEVVNKQVDSGVLLPEIAEQLLSPEQSRDFEKHLRDFFLCDVAVHIPSLITLAGGLGYGVSTGSAEVVLGTIAYHGLPVKPGIGGIARGLWLGFRAVQDHRDKENHPKLLHPIAESANIGLAMVSPFGMGHLSEPIRMARAHPEAGQVLATHFIDKAKRTPLIGNTVARWSESYFNKVSKA